MTPFETYKKYLALKNHFNSLSYDYFKYQGKMKIRAESFETRKDKYQFYKLSKHKDVENFLVSNFVNRDVKWVGDLFEDQSQNAYNEWLKRKEALTYFFNEDLDKLLTNFNDNIKIVSGQHPELLKLFNKKKISIETLIILNDIFDFFPYWNRKIEDTIIWPEIYKKCIKYKPFINYNMFKCKEALKQKFLETENV